jgi:type IV pilus assembly protein PilN
MIRINLLTVERERPAKRAARTAPLHVGQKLTLACTLILLVGGLTVGWWYWYLQRESAKLDTEIAAAQRETARLRSLIQQVEIFDLRRGQLQQRVTLIEQLRKGQSGPVHMLDEISRALPNMVWLNDLKQDGADITMTGRCMALTSLSDFVGNLEASGYFKRPVEIVDSQVEAGREAQADMIKFTIKAQFSPPGG